MSQKPINATAVVPLTNHAIDFFRKIQMTADIPENAKYLAFLEDGNACFLEEIQPRWPPAIPQFVSLSYYTGIEVLITE